MHTFCGPMWLICDTLRALWAVLYTGAESFGRVLGLRLPD